MSVRDDKQALEPSIDKILEGIEEFSDAVSERVKSGEWRELHTYKITEVRKKLLDYELELRKLKAQTW